MDEVEKHVHAKAHFLYNKDGLGNQKDGQGGLMQLNKEYVDDYRFKYIKRKALIDPAMMNNAKYDRSLAHNKYSWKGAEGRYK